MKLLRLAILIVMCYSSAAYAQNPFTIKGVVADTASNSKMHNATITILNAKDSTLYKFTRAAANGSFAIPNMKKGNFILLLTYPEYADYVNPFTLDSAKTSIDFKTINMKSKAKLLNEVIIRGQAAAIKIKGDTTEFNAASYSIQPNDKVEDLLKKMPGIQIDKDGKITAQGKAVPKVLVDGEEFFGDDPTLVTKNLRADMVDKVQLYEKSSDQAAFTGVDDGQKTTTINIKLKEDMKKGYFGKIDAGYGTKDFYQAQAMFNLFKAKQKLAVYGTSGNNGKTGLNWDDANKYGGGNSNMEISGDMIFFSGDDDDIDGWEGQYYGEGIPRANNGGVHYDTKWRGDKESLNTNYKIGQMDVKLKKNTLNQRNLPTGINFSNSDEASEKSIFRQKLDAIYTIKLDTTSNLKISIDGTLKKSSSESDFSSTTKREDGSKLNTSERSNDVDGNEQLFNISAFYNKKLKKLGRNFSINLSQRINRKDNEGYIKSDNEFFDDKGLPKSSEIVDQFKTNKTNIAAFTSNFTYNEPITKFFSLVLNYGFSVNNSTSDRKSFNQSAPGNYNLLDPEFSNDFEATQYTNQGGAIFNYKKGKTVLGFGTKVNAVNFDQYEALSNTRYKRSFFNWLPQLNYQYKFSAQRSIRFSYNGYMQQPTVDQLQPVRVNTDPLNQPLGNPDLKPSFSSNFNFGYNSYKVISNQSIYIGGYFSFTGNAIVNNTTTDEDGKSIYQLVNLNGKTPMSYNIYGGLNRKVKLIGMDVGLNLNAGGNTGYSIINNQSNKTISTRFSPRASISRYNDKFEFNLGFGPSYNSQEASLQPERSNKGWGTGGNGYVKVILPKKISLQADAEYTYTPSSKSFNNSFEQTIINASISKSFFKKEDLKLMIRGNDLLNQNRGFSRNASANSIVQTSYNNISRYFMFSLVWDFSKMGGTPEKK